VSKRSYLNKRDKLLLNYLIKDRIDKLMEYKDVPITDNDTVVLYLEIVRYVQLGDTLHLDINELIDPEEYLKMKKFLLLKGYEIDD
jgi:hypothetical protein